MDGYLRDAGPLGHAAALKADLNRIEKCGQISFAVEGNAPPG
jgi:hypothetical protein